MGSVMGDFSVDTKVEPVAGAPGRYMAHVSRDWEIWGPNGGYLAAIALRAAGAEAKIQRPASFSCHFLRVARFEPVEIDVNVVQSGRRAESIRASLTQDGKPVLEALLRTANVVPGLEHDFAIAPEVPDPEDLKTPAELVPEGTPPPYSFWNNIETRVIQPELFGDHGAHAPIAREWYRYRPRATFDDVWVDAGRMALLVDTMSWIAAGAPHPWPRKFLAPSLEFTVWFHRAEPESVYLLSDQIGPIAQDGLMGAQGRIWSRDRKLLASGGAQLMCVPVPQQG